MTTNPQTRRQRLNVTVVTPSVFRGWLVEYQNGITTRLIKALYSGEPVALIGDCGDGASSTIYDAQQKTGVKLQERIYGVEHVRVWEHDMRVVGTGRKTDTPTKDTILVPISKNKFRQWTGVDMPEDVWETSMLLHQHMPIDT